MILSHLRLAAGACVLAAGLLLGGGAGSIAVANADSHGSTTHRHGAADGSSQGVGSARSTVSSPPRSVTNTLPNTLQGVTSVLGQGRELGVRASTGVTSPNTVPGGTDSTDTKNGAGLVAVVPKLIAQVSKAVGPVPNVVAQVPDAVGPVPRPVAQVPDAVGPVANVGGLLPSLVGPATSAVALLPSLVGPATSAVALLPSLVGPATNAVALLPSLVALGFDLIALVPEVAFAVAGGVVVPLIELPFQVLYWLVGGTEQGVGVPGIVAAGPAAATLPPVPAAPSAASPLLLPLAGAGIPTVPMVGNAVGPAASGAIATIHLARDTSLPETAAPAPKGAGWTDVLSHFWHTFGAVVAAASLAALAAAALPGVGGLGIFTAAGVRVGQRQAKAGFALQSPGIGRFARPGPLGVVRSGSLVGIRRGASAAARYPDKAA